MSVCALQYSGGWVGRQVSLKRPASVHALQCSGGWGRQSQERPASVEAGHAQTTSVRALQYSDVSLKERPVSVRALQYSGGWGRQSQERPVSVRALQYSGGRQSQRDQ